MGCFRREWETRSYITFTSIVCASSIIRLPVFNLSFDGVLKTLKNKNEDQHSA